MRNLIRAILALCLIVLSVVFAPKAEAANATCTDGYYNFKYALTGGCVYGLVTDGNGTVNFNARVVDNKADGQCVTVYFSAWGTYPRTEQRQIGSYSACGGSAAAFTSTKINKTYYPNIYHQDYAAQVALCDRTGCTNWGFTTYF